MLGLDHPPTSKYGYGHDDDDDDDIDDDCMPPFLFFFFLRSLNASRTYGT